MRLGARGRTDRVGDDLEEGELGGAEVAKRQLRERCKHPERKCEGEGGAQVIGLCVCLSLRFASE